MRRHKYHCLKVKFLSTTCNNFTRHTYHTTPDNERSIFLRLFSWKIILEKLTIAQIVNKLRIFIENKNLFINGSFPKPEDCLHAHTLIKITSNIITPMHSSPKWDLPFYLCRLSLFHSCYCVPPISSFII